MGDAGDNSVLQQQGKITLYTNHGCPWAHRAHIALKELGLEYEEVIIDLEKPRDPWYLEINPRGLVPTVQHTPLGQSKPSTIIESGLVVHYLIDTFPHLASHVLPPAKDAHTALARYQINLLIDNWFKKVDSLWFKALLMSGTEESEAKSNELFEGIKKWIEPILEDALVEGKGPFVGGAERMTLFEILVAPFILRTTDFTNGTIYPESLGQKLSTLPAYSKWSKIVVAQESVTYIWDKQAMIERVEKRLPEMRQKYGVPK